MSGGFVLAVTPRLIYVRLGDRKTFDEIDLPMVDHRNLRKAPKPMLSKHSSNAEDGFTVIFQHLLPPEGGTPS